jgi:hypothetical protein
MYSIRSRHEMDTPSQPVVLVRGDGDEQLKGGGGDPVERHARGGLHRLATPAGLSAARRAVELLFGGAASVPSRGYFHDRP